MDPTNLPLPAVAVDFARLSIWLVALTVIFLPLERLFGVRPQAVFRKAIGVDLCYYFLTGLLTATLLSFPVAALAWVCHRLVPGELHAWTDALPFWASAAAGLVVAEVGYYWGHRWCHEVPLLWRFHAIHHSAEAMDFLVNTRAHPLDMVFGRFCGLVPVFVLGLGGPATVKGTLVPAVSLLVGTVWGFFIHANVRWRFGPLEWLVSTPAFHHWHHTKAGPINRNYSSTLPWLDWLFGSLHLPAAWPADYGIKAPMPAAFIDQLGYPLFPPGGGERAPAAVAPRPADAGPLAPAGVTACSAGPTGPRPGSS